MVQCRSLMTFINSPVIWQRLEVVRFARCSLPGIDASELDYGAVGELLVRSRVKVLDMSYTELGDRG